MKLKLIGIGALGKMLSPSSRHLKGSELASYVRILDREKNDAHRNASRTSWQEHGASLVNSQSALIGDGDFDGIVICAGKNGDDHEIFKQLLPQLSKFKKQYFILHLSTVSSEFVKKTHAYCKGFDINYLNYPLTGGVAGAENAKMLILAGGDKTLYDKLQPMLSKIGAPKYLGAEVDAGARFKLIGHVMVFNNLLGISSAVALHERSFTQINAEERAANFDFLNQGAGGSKQWDVTLRPAVVDKNLSKGFLLQHAVVDILYTVQLMRDNKMPHFTIWQFLELALCFSHILNNDAKQEFATQSLIECIRPPRDEKVQAFIDAQLAYPDLDKTIKNCVASLPAHIKASVMLEVDYKIASVDIKHAMSTLITAAAGPVHSKVKPEVNTAAASASSVPVVPSTTPSCS